MNILAGITNPFRKISNTRNPVAPEPDFEENPVSLENALHNTPMLGATHNAHTQLLDQSDILCWPPVPVSPSTRPLSSAPPLFSAHLLRYEGCADHFYEDATAFNATSGFAAVADGVTVSSRSDLFAECLTRHFVQGEFHLELPNERETWWNQCTREWQVQVTRTYSEMSAEQQQQFASGSAATFIGLRIDPKQGMCLYGIGDCYALCFKGDKLSGIFPEAARFNNSPVTIDTRQKQSTESIKDQLFPEPPGDMIVLCSDALAEYLLTSKPWEQDKDFWPLVRSMDDKKFGNWSDSLKSLGVLKDDDYTLLLLCFTPDAFPANPIRPSAREEQQSLLIEPTHGAGPEGGHQPKIEDHETSTFPKPLSSSESKDNTVQPSHLKRFDDTLRGHTVQYPD